MARRQINRDIEDQGLKVDVPHSTIGADGRIKDDLSKFPGLFPELLDNPEATESLVSDSEKETGEAPEEDQKPNTEYSDPANEEKSGEVLSLVEDKPQKPVKKSKSKKSKKSSKRTNN